MLDSKIYIPKETAEKIKAAAVLEQVIEDFTALKKSGGSLIGDCPYCHNKKFTVTPAKKVYKCFSGCQKAGKDAVKFLTDVMGKTYPEALLYLADRYNIAIEPEKPVVTSNGKKKRNRKEKFRDRQLRESGIPVQAQKWMMTQSATTKVESDRYQAATIDRFWNVIAGDDMILHYLDLNGKPITFSLGPTKRQQLIRVRRDNPSLHVDKRGNPMKYQSPFKSGSHLWIPNAILKAYKQSDILETLYICEGEKKADKMSLHGLPAVAVMGIHNFAYEHQMPQQFEQLIKRCSIVNVVFVLDADWLDISIKNGQAADQRPRTFFKAVMKFRDYFYAYHNSGIYLNIYFAHGKDPVHKGMDDVLVRELKGKEGELKEDFDKTRISRDGQGEHVNVYKITELSDYKIKEFWKLHSNPVFMEHYKEELKKLHDFKLGHLKFRYNEEEDTFELAQKLLPHEQYWDMDEYEDRNGRMRQKYVFNYTNCRYFLRNRGFGIYEFAADQYRFIQIDGKVVKETTAKKIRNYVVQFTEDIEEKNVLELLLRGGKQYLGPDKLNDMYQKHLPFIESEKEAKYLFFKSKYWKITKDEIVERPLGDLPQFVWANKVIDFDPTYIGHPMVQVEQEKDNWKIQFSDAAKQCDMANFYHRTSMFHWKKAQELVQEKGRSAYTNKEQPDPFTDQDVKIHRAHFVTKMIAAGYVMHDYLDYGNMKAVVCMDGIESEVGKSQGGSGKSIWAKQFEHLVPTEIIDGKKKNIEDDNHIYELVDERTQVVLFDDVRVNFPFEWLFSQITTGLVINPKGEKRSKITPRKFIITTNHALNGEGNSFKRRQYTIAFSDYYNEHRTVGDEFGYQLFHEWDNKQWNLFYNWMATCIQIYLKYKLDYKVPEDDIERRRMRQKMGEKFIDWAGLAYDLEPDHTGSPAGVFLNKRCERNYLYQKYLEHYPSERKYCDSKKFKEKLIIYTQYAELSFNPTATSQDRRLKSNGKEYFLLTNDQFDAATMGKRSINNDDDLKKGELPY